MYFSNKFNQLSYNYHDYMQKCIKLNIVPDIFFGSVLGTFNSWLQSHENASLQGHAACVGGSRDHFRTHLVSKPAQ